VSEPKRNGGVTGATSFDAVLRWKRIIRIDHRIVNVAPVPEFRRLSKSRDYLVPQRESDSSSAIDVGGIVMCHHDHCLTRRIETLNEVDLVVVSQGAVHEQIARIVISRIERDDNPLVRLNREVARVLLLGKRLGFQSLA